MAFTLREIADLVGGEVIGDDRIRVTGIKPLDKASPGELSFFTDRRYKDHLRKTRASAMLVPEVNGSFNGPQVVVPNPAIAYARVAGLFAPPAPRFQGISDRAVIHEKCRVGENASIYPLVYLGEESVIGDEVILYPGVFVGDRVKIGNKSVIYPNVTIMHDCLIGKGVIIHGGTVIGSDGFGFVRDGSINVKIPQTGIVQIDDQVEIGANNTIDRATLGRTWVQRGVKTDNLVHIAHNVIIGEDAIVVAQVGISGSVEIGREVVIGGQVGIADHLKIGDRAMIGSQSGVAKSIAPGKLVSGTPAMPHQLFLRTSGIITRLPQIYDRLRALEKKLDKFEKG